MQVLVGTSGYSYAQWRGRFYPKKTPAAEMMRRYGERLPTVEINNTFYKLPTVEVLAHWASEVPASFRFVLKASRFITHQLRLSNAGEAVKTIFALAGALGDKRGPFLCQLPGNAKKDAARLREFLGVVPQGMKVALEFRHASWFDDEVYEALRARDAALCWADHDDPAERTPLVSTASWGYVRLRRESYSKKSLDAWVERIRAQPWSEAYAFLKHEERGPLMALAMMGRMK